MTIPEPLPRLLTIDELADHLGTSTRHVRRLIAERRVPCVKVGWFIRFDPDEIAAWLEGNHHDVEAHPTAEGRRRRSDLQSAGTVRGGGRLGPRQRPYADDAFQDQRRRRSRG